MQHFEIEKIDDIGPKVSASLIEAFENKAFTKEIKALMKDYTRDLPLDRLEKQYAMAFLNESLVSSAGQFFFKSDCGPH